MLKRHGLSQDLNAAILGAFLTSSGWWHLVVLAWTEANPNPNPYPNSMKET